MTTKLKDRLPTRRQVLHALAALSASGVLPSRGISPAFAQKTGKHPGIQFGAQTNAWAIDPKRFDTFLAVLGQIRQIGYTGFETGFINVMNQFQSPQQAHQQIEETGLKFFGMHVFLSSERYDPTTRIPPPSLYRKIAPSAVSLGARHLIFSGAPVQSAEELKQKIAGLNAAGKYSKSIGLPLAYHNEKAQEFQSHVFGSRFGEMEALYDRTDPEFVSFLLDCGHAYQGGADVPAFLRKYHQRIIGLHLRDYKNGTQVPLGQGTFPLTEVAATLKQLHWHGWVLNEEERLDGSKYGEKVMGSAFKAMQGAFSA